MKQTGALRTLPFPGIRLTFAKEEEEKKPSQFL
jgi:hypothetical protein